MTCVGNLAFPGQISQSSIGVGLLYIKVGILVSKYSLISIVFNWKYKMFLKGLVRKGRIWSVNKLSMCKYPEDGKQ